MGNVLVGQNQWQSIPWNWIHLNRAGRPRNASSTRAAKMQLSGSLPLSLPPLRLAAADAVPHALTLRLGQSAGGGIAVSHRQRRQTKLQLFRRKSCPPLPATQLPLRLPEAEEILRHARSAHGLQW